MTLISSLILDAFREGNILPLGRAPNANQSAEALRLYNGLLNAMYGTDAGENFQDWPLGNYERQHPDNCWTESERAHPKINTRLLVLNEAAMTIYLTPRPQDGSRYAVADIFGRLASVPLTLDGNGRPIEGGADILLNTDGLFRSWFYRADLGEWVRVTDKLESDESPFPAEFDTLFIILLAMRLNPRYGRALDEQSALMLKQGKRNFVNRYLQSQPLDINDDISWPFMSTQSYDVQRSFSSQRAFDQGSYWR